MGTSILTIDISVPGKINLWLEVLQKREDGYHELSSLMLPISVYDHLEMGLLDHAGIHLECDHPGVPGDSANLAWKAAESYLKALGERAGVHIKLSKNIPVGAGLGGGSADAAAVLLGMNRLFEYPFPVDKLHQLALMLGADVPFFLYRRPALATGIGENLQELDGIPAYPLVLIKMPVAVSTRWVYQSLKLTRGRSRIKLASFLSHPWQVEDVLENDLETVTQEKFPLLTRMKAWLRGHGAVGALMSGSGPTVFGVFPEKGSAEKAALLAGEEWKDCYVAVAEVLTASPAGEKWF
ncbi:4-diphosphocytidyl-2-C-methyl-D-erythritol kinase [Desulforhabdus amnigena]|uniref:4-diphosphocytidyl-2-C-methyl-D-erythritol kinase n=1 Tax=Desulforhabdus amnigena TaxID=40218 RepID=A0A9W6D5W3_9BACT|nr:4-diphosphocytidyl-2-C-methyl-D-erythritol kinase [Desulforhabdus amnigena]